jgi:hypothetical protein
MKATLFRQHGGPEVLDIHGLSHAAAKSWRSVDPPARRRAQPHGRDGPQWLAGLKLELPHINGADGAGEIAELGEGVEWISSR